jgi:MFS family permease
MVGRGFLSQNVAIGASFGTFGVSVLALQDRYDSTRAEASMGLALAVLAMGLAGPLAAGLIGRIGLRATMLLGVALSGIGYAVLAVAPTMLVALAAFGLLIGPGIAMCGPLPASMLAGGWLPQNRGRAVGIANMPLFVALLPLAAFEVVGRYGLSGLFLGIGALHLLLVPVLLGVADPPLREAEPSREAFGKSGVVGPPSGALLLRPIFWLIVLGSGLLSVVGIIGVSHMVALGVEKGLAPGSATLLLSVTGGASVVGSVLSGLFCDRLGGARTLALAGLGYSVSWATVYATSWLPAMVPAMLMIGACGAAVFPTVNVLAAQAFGAASLHRVLGYLGLLTLPLTFLLPPAAGALRDAAGDYDAMMLAMIGCCGFVALAFFVVAHAGARHTGAAARPMRYVPSVGRAGGD